MKKRTANFLLITGCGVVASLPLGVYRWAHGSFSSHPGADYLDGLSEVADYLGEEELEEDLEERAFLYRKDLTRLAFTTNSPAEAAKIQDEVLNQVEVHAIRTKYLTVDQEQQEQIFFVPKESAGRIQLMVEKLQSATSNEEAQQGG